MPKKPDLRALARQHTELAIEVLAGIMNNPESPPGARLAAAQTLIERGWGKPTGTGADAEHDGPRHRTIFRRIIVKPDY